MDESAQDAGLDYSNSEGKNFDLGLPSCSYSFQGINEHSAKQWFPLCIRLLISTTEII